MQRTTVKAIYKADGLKLTEAEMFLLLCKCSVHTYTFTYPESASLY